MSILSTWLSMIIFKNWSNICIQTIHWSLLSLFEKHSVVLFGWKGTMCSIIWLKWTPYDEIVWMSLKHRCDSSFNYLRRRLWSIDILWLCHNLILGEIGIFIWLAPIFVIILWHTWWRHANYLHIIFISLELIASTNIFFHVFLNGSSSTSSTFLFAL